MPKTVLLYLSCPGFNLPKRTLEIPIEEQRKEVGAGAMYPMTDPEEDLALYVTITEADYERLVEKYEVKNAEATNA